MSGEHTPVQLHPDAPTRVRAAAVAWAVAIDDMVLAQPGDALLDAQETARAYRDVVESAGWRLAGIVTLDSGERGWRLEPQQ